MYWIVFGDKTEKSPWQHMGITQLFYKLELLLLTNLTCKTGDVSL